MLIISKRKLEFSVIGFILGCFYFFLSFVLLHGYWLGNPFESFLSLLVTIYLGACTWALSYIAKEFDRFDSEVERLGLTIFKGLSVILYFVAPVVYIYLKFFDVNKVVPVRSKEEKLEFSVVGFILGCFFFFFSFVFLHASWIGNSFESPLSILVTVYLGICTWSLSYIYKELETIIDFVIEKPLGHVILLFVHLMLYFASPVIYIRLKFFEEK